MPPLTPLSTKLPFAAEEFSWSTFEDFLCAFLASQPTLLAPDGTKVRVVRARPYGRKGDSQHGIDIKAEMENGQTWAIQCKHYPKSGWGPAKTRKAIADCTYEADRKLLLVTRELSEACFDVVRNHEDWELWDSRIISSEFLNRVDQIKGAAIVYRHFGPDWPRAFFDLPTTLPVIGAEARYFKYLQKGRNFHFRTPLVGRKEELKALHDFVKATGKEVLLFPGRGGIGKSRLLLEFSREFNRKHKDATLWFLSDDANTSSDFAKAIDAAPKPLVLVLDDAHNFGDIRRALFPVLGKRSNIKLILSYRPGSSEQLRQELVGFGYDSPAIVEREAMEQLDADEAMKLAETAFGNDMAPQRRQMFAHLAEECPLLVVMAAELRRSGTLKDRDIRDTDDFRDHILRRGFEADIKPLFDRWGEEAIRTLGNLVALFGPVGVDDDFLEAAADFFNSNLRHDQILEITEALEVAGLLHESDGAYRIVPDLLSDYLAFNACYTRKGQDKAFVVEIIEKFDPDKFPRIVQHVAEAEWLANAKFGSATSVMEPVWNWFRHRFEVSSFYQRREQLKEWAEIAHLQPDRTLELARLAIDLTEAAPADADDMFWFRELDHHDYVVLGVPSLISPLANARPDFTARCLDLLWEVGKNRPLPEGTNHDDEHPILAIGKIARFEYWKSAKISDVALEWVERRATDGSMLGNTNSPTFLFSTLVKPFFSIVSEETWNRGDALILGAHMLSIRKTTRFRDEALALCREVADTGSLPLALGVVTVLEESMRPLYIPFNNERTPAQERNWFVERLKGVDLASHLIDTWDDPLVLFRLRKFFNHELAYSKSVEFKKAIRPVFESIPDNFEGRLARVALSYDHDEFHENPDEDGWIERVENQWRELVTSVVQELTTHHPQPEDVLHRLEAFEDHARSNGLTPNLGSLLSGLSENRPILALEAVEKLLAKPNETTDEWFRLLVNHATRKDHSTRVRLIQTAIESGRPALVSSAIDCLAWWRRIEGQGDLPETAWDLLLSTVPGAEDRVAASLLSFVSVNKSTPKPQDWKVLEILPVSDSANLEKAIVDRAVALLKYGASKPRSAVIRRILATGIRSETAEHEGFAQPLRNLSKDYPVEVFLFLWERAQFAKTTNNRTYHALPTNVEDFPFIGIQDEPVIAEFLETLTDRILCGPDLEADEKKLLRSILFQGNDGDTLRFQAILAEVDEEGFGRLIDLVVRPFGHPVVLIFPEFISELLAKAKSFGEVVFETTFRRLKILPGVRSSTNGKPDAEWKGLIKDTEKLAHRYSEDTDLGRLYRAIVSFERTSMHDPK